MPYLCFNLLVIHIYVLQILLTLINICIIVEDQSLLVKHRFLNQILDHLLIMGFINIFELHIYDQS